MDLLERDALLDALDARLAAAIAGSGSLVLVAGEAGVGKSTLAAAFCARHELDAAAWWGGCDWMRTARPLGPLHDIARAAGGPLAGLMAADATRHEIFATFLDSLCTNGAPVIVTVEDVHWADEATLDLLVFLGRRVGSSRAVVLATYRDDEVHPNHPLRTALGHLATTAGVHRLTVAPLSREAVSSLVATRQAAVDADRVFDVTGGNPFFVTEILAVPAGTVPPTVSDAVLARISRLSVSARAAMDAASLVPNQIEVSLLRQCAVDDSAIDDCQRAGILLGDGTALRFRHELARLAVEQAVPTARRTDIHARILRHLLGQSGVDPARLAHHADEAGDGQAVLALAPAAAAQASRLGAHREAAAHYARALRYSTGEPAEVRAQLSESLGEECASAGLIREALHASQEAMLLWRDAGDRDREGALMARRGHLLWINGRSAEAYEAAEAAVALLEQRPPGPGLAAAYTHLAYLRMLARDVAGATAVGQQAIDLATSQAQDHLMARALNALGTAQWFTDPDHAADTLARSIDAARACGDDLGEAAALCNLGSGAGEIRRYPAADNWLGRALAWAGERDLDAYRVYSLAWLARSHFEQGRWARATAVVAEALAQPTEHVPSRIVALTTLGRLRARRGDADAWSPLNEASALAASTGDLQRMWPVGAACAEAAWLDGRPEAIAAGVAPVFAAAVALGHSWAVGELGFWLWRVGVIAEAPPGAAEPYALHMSGEPGLAAERWRALGCPYEAAVALADCGTAEEMMAAHAQFVLLDAWPAADGLARRLREIGQRNVPRRPRQATLDNPARLTGREMDVLRLIADGMRNTEIAARLHISPKTVDHHVSAVLSKLGVASRREAARAATRLLAVDTVSETGSQQVYNRLI